MIICAAGDIHGAVDRLYEDVLDFEEHLGVAFDYVLHVGDFGIWPDPERIDRATRRHDGAGDFHHWFADNKPTPRPTVFIKGNHEDFDWLARREAEGQLELLPGLQYLPNGHRIELAAGDAAITVGGVGGCYSATDYVKTSSQLTGRARSHYTSDEVRQISSAGRLDLLLLHDAPAGIMLTRYDRGGRESGSYDSGSKGLVEAVLATSPRLCFFGHHHTRGEGTIGTTNCVGLNLVGRVGYLVAVEFTAQPPAHRLLGEWLPPA